MGLDTVAVIMAIEDTFKISITDEDAEKCKTIRDVIDTVAIHVDPQRCDTCRSSHAFYSFRRALLEVLPLTRSDIRPSSQLEAMIPRRERQAIWERLKLYGADLPKLERSDATQCLAAVASIAPFVLLKVFLGNWWPLLGIVPAAFVAEYLTRPLAVCAPSTFKTVGGAAMYLAARQPDAKPFTHTEVSEGVRRIISEQFKIPIEELTDDTRWCELE